MYIYTVFATSYSDEHSNLHWSNIKRQKKEMISSILWRIQAEKLNKFYENLAVVIETTVCE